MTPSVYAPKTTIETTDFKTPIIQTKAPSGSADGESDRTYYPDVAEIPRDPDTSVDMIINTQMTLSESQASFDAVAEAYGDHLGNLQIFNINRVVINIDSSRHVFEQKDGNWKGPAGGEDVSAIFNAVLSTENDRIDSDSAAGIVDFNHDALNVLSLGDYVEVSYELALWGPQYQSKDPWLLFDRTNATTRIEGEFRALDVTTITDNFSFHDENLVGTTFEFDLSSIVVDPEAFFTLSDFEFIFPDTQHGFDLTVSADQSTLIVTIDDQSELNALAWNTPQTFTLDYQVRKYDSSDSVTSNGTIEFEVTRVNQAPVVFMPDYRDYVPTQAELDDWRSQGGSEFFIFDVISSRFHYEVDQNDQGYSGGLHNPFLGRIEPEGDDVTLTVDSIENVSGLYTDIDMLYFAGLTLVTENHGTIYADIQINLAYGLSVQDHDRVPLHVSFSLQGTFDYLDENEYEIVRFYYTATDEYGASSTGHLQVQITGLDDPVQFIQLDAPIVVNEDGVKEFNLTVEDIDLSDTINLDGMTYEIQNFIVERYNDAGELLPDIHSINLDDYSITELSHNNDTGEITFQINRAFRASDDPGSGNPFDYIQENEYEQITFNVIARNADGSVVDQLDNVQIQIDGEQEFARAIDYTLEVTEGEIYNFDLRNLIYTPDGPNEFEVSNIIGVSLSDRRMKFLEGDDPFTDLRFDLSDVYFTDVDANGDGIIDDNIITFDYYYAPHDLDIIKTLTLVVKDGIDPAEALPTVVNVNEDFNGTFLLNSQLKPGTTNSYEYRIRDVVGARDGVVISTNAQTSNEFSLDLSGLYDDLNPNLADEVITFNYEIIDSATQEVVASNIGEINIAGVFEPARASETNLSVNEDFNGVFTLNTYVDPDGAGTYTYQIRNIQARETVLINTEAQSSPEFTLDLTGLYDDLTTGGPNETVTFEYDIINSTTGLVVLSNTGRIDITGVNDAPTPPQLDYTSVITVDELRAAPALVIPLSDIVFDKDTPMESLIFHTSNSLREVTVKTMYVVDGNIHFEISPDYYDHNDWVDSLAYGSINDIAVRYGVSDGNSGYIFNDIILHVEKPALLVNENADSLRVSLNSEIYNENHIITQLRNEATGSTYEVTGVMETYYYRDPQNFVHLKANLIMNYSDMFDFLRDGEYIDLQVLNDAGIVVFNITMQGEDDELIINSSQVDLTEELYTDSFTLASDADLGEIELATITIDNIVVTNQAGEIIDASEYSIVQPAQDDSTAKKIRFRPNKWV